MVTRVCVSVCLSVGGRMPTLLHRPGCNLGSGRDCPLVVHYWADLQSVHELRCYGNITRTRSVSEYMLVLALRLVIMIIVRLADGCCVVGLVSQLYSTTLPQDVLSVLCANFTGQFDRDWVFRALDPPWIPIYAPRPATVCTATTRETGPELSAR